MRRAALHEKERTKRTLLSHEDLAGMIKAAIETAVPFGTYYAVSEKRRKALVYGKHEAGIGLQSSYKYDRNP
ncbi:hypothetical protein ACEQPO_22515 [Bacillus sp. SL00103]